MPSFNKVVLVGNVTREIEVRYTPGGTAVCDVGLAVNRQWKDRDSNERREDTTFVDVTLWGRTAEVAGEYLRKGNPVLFEGRLQMDQWVDRETGQKRSRLKVIGESMQLLATRGGHSSGVPAASGGQSAVVAAETAAESGEFDTAFAGSPDDDVPF